MGLFSHKDETPRIPPSPTLPKLPDQKARVSELPSMTQNIPSNLNEEIIKSAINDSSEEKDVISHDELEPRRFGGNHIPMPPSSSMQPGSNPLLETQNYNVPQKGTIFVKIDKYNRAQDALRDIEEKIKQMSVEIQTLREIKVREVKELEIWDEELKKINARLTKIDAGIFGEL